MPGTRLEQVLAPGADRLYTLYTSARPGYAPHQAPVPANASVSFVHVLDLQEGWAHCVGLPERLWDRPAAEQAMAVSPDGSRLFVVDAALGIVTALDTSTLETRVAEDVGFGEVGGASSAAVVSADGRTLFVAAGGRDSTLFAVDIATFEVVDRWSVDGRVSGLGLSGDGERLYVASGRGVAVVDPRTGERLVEVPLGETGPVVRISPVGA
jgi:DNA-binding beta-propeller fold protein YncE